MEANTRMPVDEPCFSASETLDGCRSGDAIINTTVLEGLKMVFDWITLLAMFGSALVFGLLLSGRMRPK